MAWKNDFMVQQLHPQPFSSVVRASGEILAVPGEKKNVAANSSGMVVFEDRTLVQGSRVERDQHLFTITANMVGSDNFELMYREYLNRLNRSRSEYERHTVLFESNVIPERQYLESRTAYISDSIRFYDLSGKAGKDGMRVSAPAEGFIHHLNVAEGQYVEAGELLLTISSDRNLLLRADIPQQHYDRIKKIVTANFRPAFTERIYSVDELNGRLLARGSSVAENDHYIPLYFEVRNDGSLLEGAYAEFYLIAGQEANRLLVPETALFEEQGNHYVYLQISGETYTKRAIIPGQSDGIRVEVLSGLHAGDRVVTTGTMLLKSASMVAGDGGHEGHSH
jgi:RND family efflux transporter MFP subunit